MTLTGNNSRARVRMLYLGACLLLLSGLIGCSGGGNEPTKATQYPVGFSEDIEKLLKYDSRVQDFEADGDTLIVNVNQAWVDQPQGMHERTMGQWYSLWKASQGGKAKLVVKYEGNEVDTFTADKGYQPVIKEKETDHNSES